MADPLDSADVQRRLSNNAAWAGVASITEADGAVRDLTGCALRALQLATLPEISGSRMALRLH